jgi:hypothetical protein
MVIERWHGVHLSREFATGLFLLISCLERKQAPRARREEADTADRALGDLQTNSMAWTACRDTMSARRLKLCQALVGRQGVPRPNFRQHLQGGATGKAQPRARMHSICELMQILLNGANASFLCRSSRAITCGFSLVHVQLFNDRTSAHSREGFSALRSHYARSLVDIMRGTALCTAGDCAVLQPGNGEAAVSGVGRWVLRSHNDTMAFPLPNPPAYDPWTQLEFRA